MTYHDNDNPYGWPALRGIGDEGPIKRQDCGSAGIAPGSCGLYAAIGQVSLTAALEAAKTMQERGTFGSGVLLHGIYPKRKNLYAFHVLYRTREIAKQLEPVFTENQGMRHFGEMEPLVTPEAYRKYALPEMRRYFISPPTVDEMLRRKHTGVEDVYVRRLVEDFNRKYMGDARIFSSGKNVGTFLTALQLEDTIEIFDLAQYEARPISAIMIHMRWPTSIVASGVWWGAHPISFLNSAIIHNGDLSSAESNRQGLESAQVSRMIGTDSEAILLELDDMAGRRGFSYEQMEWSLCRKFPAELTSMDPHARARYLELTADPELARYKMSGPSSFVALINGKVIAGRDRDGLRQLWMGRSEDGKTIIWGSEEKVIYQSAWLMEKNFRASNCEPGKITAFELDENSGPREAYGETLGLRTGAMPI